MAYILYVLIIIIGGLASLFLPWWVVAPVCFGLSFWLADSGKAAFAVGGAAVSSLWLSYALFLNLTAEISLIPKITGLLTGGTGFLSHVPQQFLGFAIMTFIAGLVGGFSGLAGYQWGQLFADK